MPFVTMECYCLPTAREGSVIRNVCHSVQDGGNVTLDPHLGGDPPGKKHWDPLVLTSSGGHCNDRYASYCNAFLYL